MLYALCRILFTLCVAYPVTHLWLGVSLRGRETLPARGPAVVVANHNSHLDNLVLLTRFPLRLIPRVRIAAAADYFFANPVSRFVSTRLLGLIPVERRGEGSSRDPLADMAAWLEGGGILVLFPEGTRGRPEALGEFKPGLWHLLKRCPAASLHPVYLHGLGRSLPKGEWIPVPFFIDVCIGGSIAFDADKKSFMQTVRDAFYALREHTLAALHEHWDDEPEPEGAPHEQAVP